MRIKRRADPLLVLAVLVVGVATRLLPLHLSPLPFNTDGFVYVRRAEQILDSNHVAISGPTAPFPDEYLFDMLLAMLSELVGIPPLYLVQILVACLAVVPPLVAISYVRSLTETHTRSRQRLAAAFAGLGLSIEGLYLWRTATVSSEVYGLVFIAVIVLALHRALLTSRHRWVVLTVSLSVLMPIVHNGSTFVAGLIGTTLVALAIGRRFTIRRAVLGGIGIIGFWLVAFGYYEVMEMPNSATISTAPGLFIGWTILVVALVRWLDTSSSTLQQTVPLGVFSLGVGVFILNAALPIFPGMPSTSPALLLYTLPLVVLLIGAGIGLPLASNERGLAMIAVTLAPLSALGFALTGGRTADYQGLLTRSTTFMHLGVLVLAAVALVWVLKQRPLVGRVTITIAVVALLVTMPFPFAGLDAKPFEATTEPDEFETATFAVEYIGGDWTSDDHITLIANFYRGANAPESPTNAWLRGETPPPNCPVVGRERWTTRGAPAVPEPLSISPAAYEEWTVSGDVIYSSGAHDNLVIRWGSERCDQPTVDGERG